MQYERCEPVTFRLCLLSRFTSYVPVVVFARTKKSHQKKLRWGAGLFDVHCGERDFFLNFLAQSALTKGAMGMPSDTAYNHTGSVAVSSQGAI